MVSGIPQIGRSVSDSDSDSKVSAKADKSRSEFEALEATITSSSKSKASKASKASDSYVSDLFSSDASVTVVELDAPDAKNVFYLPKKAAYTAVMDDGGGVGGVDETKAKEKMRVNEQLVLESIGKANRCV
jgi:hypothetical protein